MPLILLIVVVTVINIAFVILHMRSPDYDVKDKLEFDGDCSACHMTICRHRKYVPTLIGIDLASTKDITCYQIVRGDVC